MSNQVLAAAVLAAGVALLPAAHARAECPEGESEVTIVTPNGMEKLLCIPDPAVAGLEKAADHSQGTVIPAVCPCFTAAEVEAALASDPDLICTLHVGITNISGEPCTQVICFDSVFFEAFEGPPEQTDGRCVFEGPPRFVPLSNNQCFSDPTGNVSITEAEADACVAILESFVEEP